MPSGIQVIGEAIATLAGSDVYATQLNTSGDMLMDTMAYLKKNEAFSAQLTRDEEMYVAASAQAAANPQDPSYPAKAAADYQQYQVDEASMNNELGSLDNLIQSGKVRLQQEGDASDNLYSIEDPIVQLLRAASSALKANY